MRSFVLELDARIWQERVGLRLEGTSRDPTVRCCEIKMIAYTGVARTIY